MPERPRHASRVFSIGLLAVCALGLVLRALHLAIPMRYDETVTYVVYASQGWDFAISAYDTPNNHVFHTLLVGWLTDWFGGTPAVIRLPAFFAGCMLIPIAAWVGRQAHGKEAGLIAATVVATSPVLIEYSTNARGYTLLALCTLLGIGIGQRLLKRRSTLMWMLWVEVGVIGFFTLPTMVLPWAGITLWLGGNMALSSEEVASKRRGLGALAASTALVLGISAALYYRIIANAGLDALTGNRFVQAEPLAQFVAAAPIALWETLTHWSRGIPWPLALAAAGLIGAATVLRRKEHRLSLPLALTVGALFVMLGKRNWGEPRIWLWVVPLLGIAVGIGATELARRWRARHELDVIVGASTVWAVAMSLTLFVARPVYSSLETGAFPEAETVVQGMREYFRPGDFVLSDFVSGEPLRYYVELYGLGRGVSDDGVAAVQRSWIVRNRSEPIRVQRLNERVARMGAPPLDESTPIFSVGNADAFLYGRPAQSADPRLVEAVEWYTGVAGSVDDRRANSLLQEVIDDTASPLSLMWLARCHSRGRMLFERDEARADAIARSVYQEVRELAETGEAEAIFLVGSAFAEGFGIEADEEEAVRWYRLAAERGHVLAQHNMGNAYASGAGVEEDAVQAVFWWTLAAEQGDAVTQLRLGESYEAGRGVAVDLQRARDWYSRSAERGNADAREALDRLRG